MKSDVLVVGSGIAGSALACCLAQAGLKIRLVSEKKPQDRVSPCLEIISPISKKFMSSINTWETIPRARKFGSMTIWDYFGTGSMTFESPGWIVERDCLESVHFQKASEVAELALGSVSELQTQKDRVKVKLDNGDEFEASMVVGADGKNSRIRHLMGVQTKNSNYPYDSLQFIVKSKSPVLETSQKYLKSGIITVLPTWEGHAGVIWAAPRDQVSTLKEMASEELVESLNLALSSKPVKKFPRQYSVSSPEFSSLASEVVDSKYEIQHSKRLMGKRSAIIGEAGHTVHPIAGELFNLCAYDVINLSNSIIKGLSGNLEKELAGFESTAKFYGSMLGGVERMVVWAYYDVSAVHYLRNLQYTVLDSISPLKSMIVAGATGKYFVPSDWLWVGK